MEFRTIKAERLYIKVAEQLSGLVKDGTLKPGDKFPAERDLAERLGVSRPTIREAMIAMELSGIIEIRTGSGIYVSDTKPKLDTGDKGVGPFEILEIRYILEAEACALAAARITDEEIAKLKVALQDMAEEEKHEDASEKADWTFHKIIADASQNSAISAVVDWLWQLRNESELSTAFLERLRKEGVHPSIDDHKRIIEALEQRNPEKARNAMRVHIDNASEAAATYFGRPS
ncbi:FadR family transcriptional regulator [Gilvimarinus agarilyticus]|uniref:FadR/GntR family transcriptional regulator n=1 Tax=Gilvimarinus sp. 2_MG-2023 TaxID=3062666 RepID=UPI001C092AA3|nr:FadR/GntR family transcriptional regulator [Gilvimarinus sp. 2_MG-2023]MBU2886708.1 FadR family transcriptional regulator [Gilvimarinus agarilyticus]MDO6571374.1 FadR/GntR family transcriptional regulator [Gilvimarinus sp. 2_MG-2023]